MGRYYPTQRLSSVEERDVQAGEIQQTKIKFVAAEGSVHSCRMKQRQGAKTLSQVQLGHLSIRVRKGWEGEHRCVCLVGAIS